MSPGIHAGPRPAPLEAGRITHFACGLLVFLFALASARAAEFYVAPNGSDQNPGSSAQPWATLAGARDGLRLWRKAHFHAAEPLTVWLRAGEYPLSATAEFTPSDSGTAAETPVIYAAAPAPAGAAAAVRLTGAEPLAPDWFTPVSAASPGWARLDPAARGHVYLADLKSHGLTDWGRLQPRGFSLRAAAPLELYCNHEPMTLARWPNAGEPDPFARTGAPASAAGFTYLGTRPARWVTAPDAWLHGFWSEDWADFHVPMARVDPRRRTITLAAPPAQYGLAAGRPFVAYNLLEELDCPGEYYLDRSNGLLYFWPPVPLPLAALEVSRLETPLIAVTGARFLTFQGLTLEMTRGPLTVVTGGTGVRFEHCVLRNAGQFAAALSGTDNGLDGCILCDCGEEGVRLAGGDRASLTAGNNFVTNCEIRRTGAAGWTYKPAISFEGGCGNLAAHNLIEDLPHTAILFAGNNHVMAFNEIRGVCELTGDSGAIYGGRNWGFRGNRIEFNYLHDIASRLGPTDVNGVYLDDCLSGVSVFANVFYAISGTAVFCGGGRDNLITNNLIARCGTAHYDDDRGRRQITDKPGDAWNLLESLKADRVDPRRDPWLAAYPGCAAIPASFAEIVPGVWRNPEHSVFARNAGWENRRWLKESNDSNTGVFSLYDSMADNRPEIPPALDPRQARAESLTVAVPGFVPIPFGAIGPAAGPNGAPGIPLR